MICPFVGLWWIAVLYVPFVRLHALSNDLKLRLLLVKADRMRVRSRIREALCCLFFVIFGNHVLIA